MGNTSKKGGIEDTHEWNEQGMINVKRYILLWLFVVATGLQWWDGGKVWAEVKDRPEPGKPPENVTIVVDLQRNQLTLYRDGVPHKKYPIALGRPETPTPVGDWKVINKYKNWGKWFGTRWIGLNVPWGIYGIHGTNKPHSIGEDASHGCIRMLNRHIEELYEYVHVGTKIIVIGHPLGEPHLPPRRIAKGDRGADVMLVQHQLRGAGLYRGNCHGIFDSATEIAMKSFEKQHGLQVNGVVGLLDYIALGVLE